MNRRKRLIPVVLGVMSACALMMAIGASAASALQVKSCENNTLSTCKKATTPTTTFSASGSNIKLSNGFLTNECTGAIGGKVTDAESLSGTDPITASLTSASFTSCSFATVTTEKLPWTLESNSVEFPAGTVQGVQVTLAVPFVGNCTFADSGTNVVTAKWNNGTGTTKSSVTLGGTLTKTAGSSACGSTGSISGTETLTAVSDPNNTKANNIRIE